MDFGRCRILKDWPDWDYSIHANEEQIARQGRAMTYPLSFEINEKRKIARFSSSSDLPYYSTTLAECNCNDFQLRKLPCKHIYRLAVELGLIEIIRRTSHKPGGYDKDKVSAIQASSDVDNEPDQVKRQKSAMSSKCTPVEINYEDKTAIFSGSGKSPYHTTVNSCTCRDFIVRRLPCKHIYRLRHELSK